MFKLVCLDLDGTVYDSQKQVRPGIVQAVKAVRARGIPVVLISGRPPVGMLDAYQALDLNEPIVGCSGGVLVEALREDGQGKVLAEEVIPAATVQQVYEVASDLPILISFYAGMDWIVEGSHAWIKREEGMVGFPALQRPFEALIADWAGSGQGPCKILGMMEPDQMSVFEDRLNDKGIDGVNLLRSGHRYLDIVRQDISKATGVKHLQEIFGVEQEAVFAIGDNFNDLEMLSYVGMGVAMGNAPDAVKAAADAVTLDNNAEGVRVALEQYVLS